MSNYDLIKSGIHEMRQRLAANLPAGDAVRFQSQVMNLIDSNPELAECTPGSVFGCAMLIAQLGLESSPILGQAWVIPRVKSTKTNGTWTKSKEATFQLGYRGAIQLALRSGEVLSIEGNYVCENDNFKIEFGTSRLLRHSPALKNRGDVIGYYAIAEMANGGHAFDFMNIEEVHAVRDQYGGGGSKGPWVTAPTEMGKKTVIKRLTKYLPVKTDYAKALSFEGHTIRVNDGGDVESLDGLEFFDVTDAIPETAKLDKPNDVKTHTKSFDYIKERRRLRAVIGSFSDAKQADIMAAIKWKCDIESFSDKNAENVTQDQLEKVNKLTIYLDTKEPDSKNTRADNLISEHRESVPVDLVEVDLVEVEEVAEEVSPLLLKQIERLEGQVFTAVSDGDAKLVTAIFCMSHNIDSLNQSSVLDVGALVDSLEGKNVVENVSKFINKKEVIK